MYKVRSLATCQLNFMPLKNVFGFCFFFSILAISARYADSKPNSPFQMKLGGYVNIFNTIHIISYKKENRGILYCIESFYFIVFQNTSLN